MAEVVFRPVEDGQCILQKTDEDYFTARNASESDTAVSPAKIGQKFDSPNYIIYRGGFCFDTSGLDDACLIQSATLWLHIDYSNYGLGTVMIKSGMPDHPEIPAVVGDYDRTLYSGNGGTATPVGLNITINLNHTGLGWINKTGNTKFMIMSLNDISGIAPTVYEWAGIVPGGDSRPKLTVVYTVPTGVPVVGNASYSDTKNTFTVATANVTDDGDGYKERGFEYGLSKTPTWSVSETGTFTGTGNYSLVIDGLQPSTIYYGRAYVSNDLGTNYSEWTSFTTSASPSYGIYEEENTATICFYVRKVGGKWSIKHGPYTVDQSDIEITKILTEGKGKYQIKFESDVLTGISAGVMCKVDIKAR